MAHTSIEGKSHWLGRFLAEYHERRPVNATFIGVHDYDSCLPDLSHEGVEASVEGMRSLLDDRPVTESHGSAVEVIDHRVAEGFLRIQLWEHESGHFLGNPSIHVGEVVFGMMSLLLSDFAPLDERLEALRDRMEAVPAYLAQAREHLDSAPPAWTRRAIRECDGGLAFLDHVADRPGAELKGAVSPGLIAASRIASQALMDFRQFLETDLDGRSDRHVACGPEAFDLYLREGHFLERGADEIVSYAREELERTKKWLAQSASEYGLDRPEDVAQRLSDVGPDLHTYYERYQRTWDEMRALAVERRLLTWPDSPIRYVPRPEWAHQATPSLYFLFYRSPAASGGPSVHDYLVTPIDATTSVEEHEELLRNHNDAVIKLNHVIHHGGIGHHVQNWHAFRSPSEIGRIAAVDCAARIAMFCGATMAEGWACYATDLMAEAGGLTPLEEFAEHQGRVRMCARAIVDVEFHHGRMTLDQAAAFYEETAGMSRSASEAEAVKNSMFPAAALIYLIGTDLIHELRADLMQRLGDRFTLQGFHDAFLSYGSLPVTLVAEEMKRRVEAGLPLGAHDLGHSQ